MKDEDFIRVGELLHKCFELCSKVQEKSGKKLKDFKETINTDFEDEITNIKKEVNEFAERFEFIEEE